MSCVGAIENRPRGQRVVHPEVVRGAAPLVGAGLGDDVDEPAQGAAVLGEIGGVEDAELLGGLLRRRRARQAGEGLDVVGAIDLDHRVQLGLAAEGQARRCRRTHADVRLLERAAADVLAAQRDAARQLDEVDEVPAADRQRLDLRLPHHPAEIHPVRLDERGLTADRDDLADLAEVHRDVRQRGSAHRQHDSRQHDRPEAREFRAELVPPGSSATIR